MSRKIFEDGNLDLIAGRHVTDKQLDATSNHAIANKVVTAALNGLEALIGKLKDRLNLNGCRNILYPTETASIVQNGVTMTCNNDGSITLSGSNTAGHSITFHPFPHISGRLFLHKGLYKLGGDPVGGRIRSNGSTLAYFEIRVSGNGGSATAIVADSNTATWDEFDLNNDVLNSAIESINITLVVNTAANFGSGMTIYPMLITSSTNDVEGYEQGELNNRELSIIAKENTKDIETLSANLSDLLKYEVVTSTVQLNVGETKALEFMHTTPSGYKIASVTVEVTTGGAYCQVGAVTSDRVFAEVKTVAPAPASWTVRCRLLYIPASL